MIFSVEPEKGTRGVFDVIVTGVLVFSEYEEGRFIGRFWIP